MDEIPPAAKERRILAMSFIAKAEKLYTEHRTNNPRSVELFEKSKMIAPGGVHSPVRAFSGIGGAPIFFESASGARMHSVDGKDYIDFCQSFGPLILGHRDPDVVEAVRAVSDKVWTVGACEPYSVELGEFMVERIPFLERVRFVCSGTEAVMSALRVARGATGRRKILKFNGCYNGHADNLLVAAGSGLAGETASSSEGVPQDSVQHTLIADLDDEEGFLKIIEVHGNDLAAVIIEPLPANFGLLPQREEFLRMVAEKTKACGALLIFDEVISGFRIAFGGMAAASGIEPDLVTYGKIIGGGFPVGCYGGKEKWMRYVAPEGSVYQAGTLAANPIGMAAGLATLKKMVKINAWALLAEQTKQFAKNCNMLFGKYDVPMNCVQKGSLFWFGDARETPIRRPSQISAWQREWFPAFFHAALKQGIYFAPSAYEVGFMSTAHTDAVLDEAIVGIEKALQEIHE